MFLMYNPELGEKKGTATARQTVPPSTGIGYVGGGPLDGSGRRLAAGRNLLPNGCNPRGSGRHRQRQRPPVRQRRSTASFGWTQTAIWLLGLLGIAMGTRHLRSRFQDRLRAEKTSR
jgi:hypothetical protein